MQETPVWFLGREDSLEKGISYPIQDSWASLVAQLVKNPPAMPETLFRFLSWEGPWRRERLPTPVFWPGVGSLSLLQARILEWVAFPFSRGKATHSSILAWRIPWTSPWGGKESDMTERLLLSPTTPSLKSRSTIKELNTEATIHSSIPLTSNIHLK